MIKICKCCGKEFETKNPQKLYCNGEHYLPCPICGKLVLKRDNDFSRPAKCCSKECRDKSRQKNIPERNCKLCGKLFKPTNVNIWICDDIHYRTCKICGNKFEINKSNIDAWACSRECNQAIIKQNSVEKYGYEHPMQSEEVKSKYKQTMIDRYGVSSPLQSNDIKDKVKSTNRAKFGADWAISSDVIRQKIESTNLEKYGSESPLSNAEIRKKAMSTLSARYGENPYRFNGVISETRLDTLAKRYNVSNPMQVDGIAESAKSTRLANNGGVYWTDSMESKSKKTCIEKYGVDNPAKSDDIKSKMTATLMSKYGVPYSCLISDNHHADKISNINKAFGELLDKNNVPYEFEFRIESRLYDIKLLSQNILIEIDPTYTHNAIGNHWTNKGLDKYYHKDKTQLAIDSGFRCIHVFDWDRWDKIIELLKPRTRIYARSCKVIEISHKQASEFLNKYHLQGSTRTSLINLGITYNDELLEVMTFGTPRYNKQYQWELLRLCSKDEYSVVGGANKLFREFVRLNNPDSVLSYCDLSKFTGNVYDSLGMKLVNKTEPSEIWSKGNNKITANLLRQRGVDQLLGTNYGKGTCNEELMIAEGWLPVFDCGQAVYGIEF